MKLTERRGLVAFVVSAALLFAAAGDVRAGSVLVCTKSGEPGVEAAHVAAKIFPDELPVVSAVERAVARGASRAGRTTIRLLAIRVQFQPDTDSRSTGDGTFDYSAWDGQTFDGPPHDHRYFELHMTALASYLESVSYGRLGVEFDVAPGDPQSAFVLPHDMGYYHDYSEAQAWYVDQVERFTRDAFAAADSSGTIDFSQYDGFILFHAGADWQSDVYVDSPFDLPSAHIALGEPILVNDGNWEIWGAAILPETSNQDGYAIVLNGTLAHEVGHILGLPDLYNTRNGFPAVGYWDIMDSGGRIGMSTPWGWAYGLVPAAPSAWSKAFMGWIDPVEVVDDAAELEVRGSVLRGGGHRVYEIPISSTERFLIENRFDDIGKDNLIAIEQERGVVLGPVDPDCMQEICPVNHEYDFLLPGPGLMIWYIDDTRVVPGLLPWDAVNVDRDRRGVAVEEADGIMDLGNIQSFYWTGSRYDPFFAANNDSFSWNTFPSTDDNMGGKTYVAVTRISDPDTVMTMGVRFERSKEGWPIDIGEDIGRASPRVADLDGDGVSEVVVAAQSGNVYAWRADGEPVIAPVGPAGPGFFARAEGGVSRTPAVADLDGNGDLEVVVASDAGRLYAWQHVDLNHNGAADLFSARFPVAIGGPASSAPVVADFAAAAGLEIAVAAQSGDLTVVESRGDAVGGSPYGFGHLVLDDVTIAAADLDGDALDEVVLTTTNRGWIVAMRSDGSAAPGWPVTVDEWEHETVGVVVGDLDRAADGAPEIVAFGSDGGVRAWDRRGNALDGWPADLRSEVLARAALADLDADGLLECAAAAGPASVEGLRANGTRVEDWPLSLAPGDSVEAGRSSPLVGDVDGDGDLDVVSMGSGGGLFAHDAVTGDRLAGWPLSADPGLASAWVGDAEGDGEFDVLVAGRAGRIAFSSMPGVGAPGAMVWPTEAGSPAGSGAFPDSLLADPPADVPGLLATERTYCYPNPATGPDLTIRAYLEESADLEIDILDVAGERVARLSAAGVPTVNEIVWDLSGVASGMYVVRVEASVPLEGKDLLQGRGRRTESRLMKVAVVR
jgi:M6 family metalloprotease-like protein